MWSFSQFALVLCLPSVIIPTGFASGATQVIPRDSRTNSWSFFDVEFKTLLSPNATISFNSSGAPRWSKFNAPTPGAIVHVATEQDVQVVVCNDL